MPVSWHIFCPDTIGGKNMCVSETGISWISGRTAWDYWRKPAGIFS